MLVTIKTQLLNECLKNIDSILSNLTNYYLSSVLIETKNNSLIFTSTNGEISFKQELKDVKIEKEGKIFINAKTFYQYTKKINDEQIVLNQIEENILEIKLLNGRCEINLSQSDNFPILNFDHKDWKKIILNKQDILNINEHIVPFICSNQSNLNAYNMIGGILFNKINDEEIECVSTDMYRMGYYKFKFNQNIDSFIAPKDLVKYCIEFINNKKIDNIVIFINEKNCLIDCENTIIMFKLYQEAFPITADKILVDQKYNFTIEKKEILSVLERCEVFSSNDDNKQIVNLKISNSDLHVNCENSKGNSDEKVKFINKNSDFIQIKLNLTLLVNLIKTIKSEKIIFNYDSEISPIIIKPSDNKNIVALILPIKQ